VSVLDLASERLIVVVGASGAGKDSVLRAWLDSLPTHERPVLARRTITRPAGDPTEAHEPIGDAAFAAAQATGAFAFAWQAHGLHYGIRWHQLDPLWRGRWVVMNGSRSHLSDLLAIARRARVVEIVASPAARRQRLAAREREDTGAAQARLARTRPAFDAELVVENNGELALAVHAVHRWWQQATAPAEQSR
jgi:ribose 1,5-bisphosphokinase